MTIKHKGYEYNLTDKEKEAFQTVFDVLDQLYRDDDIEKDVNDRITSNYRAFSDFRINKFLSQFNALMWHLFDLDVEEPDK